MRCFPKTCGPQNVIRKSNKMDSRETIAKCRASPTAFEAERHLQILVSDCVNFCAAGVRSRTTRAAENLFLRKQLALFQDRKKKSSQGLYRAAPSPRTNRSATGSEKETGETPAR